MADGHGGQRQGAGRPAGTKSHGKGIAQARLEKERALAGLRSLELQRAKGELVAKADVIQVWTGAHAVFTARVAALPRRLASVCGTDPSSRAAIEAEARKHCNDLLRELGYAGWLARGEPDA